MRNIYLRDKAVEYALKYAITPNPDFRFFYEYGDGGGDCTNFISQCLLAGGAPMAYDAWPWWYNNNGTKQTDDDTWSVSWAVAHSLYWTLKSRGELKLAGIKAIEVSDISLLDMGDIIQYEKDGNIYHTVIITAFNYQNGYRFPLVSQHTYNGRNVTYIKPWSNKMHFMKIYVT